LFPLLRLANAAPSVIELAGKPLEGGLDLATVVHRRPHDLDVEREERVNACFCWSSRGDQLQHSR
jgi:hypothetical protein